MDFQIYLENSNLEILNTADLPSGKKFKSRFIQAGLAGYPQQYGNVLIKKESLDKFVNTLETKPVIINHQEVTANNVNEIEVGRVHNVWFNDEDGWYWCDGVITNQKAIDLIDKGWSVSCSYNVSNYSDKGGTENNIKYDMEFLDGNFTHLAIVKNPRYEGADIVVVNSMNINNEEGKWITVHPNGEDSKGVHVFVKKGQSVDEAIDKLDKKEDKVQKDDKKVAEYKKQLHDKYKSLQTPEDKQAYIKYADEETKKYDKDVNYKEAVEWLKEVDKSDVFGKDTTKGGEDRGTKRQNKIKEMADKIKESSDYNAEYAKKTIEELSKYKGFSKYYYDIDKQDLIKEGHGDALAYIGEIYGKEKESRSKKQDKGFSILKDLMHEDATDQEKKWIADNSLTNTIAEAMAEVIAENIK